MLAPLLHWRPLETVHDGFSIILGVPWALRHLLPVNLRFVNQTDIHNLHRIHIIFDRITQKGAQEFILAISKEFKTLPITYSFHPPIAGHLIQFIDQSKFYASMNWTMGLAQCETRYAILHDFDLYPLSPHYFESMFRALRDKELRFTGLEFTHFDGLEDSHQLIGTWALGIDAQWLRAQFKPIDCFHTVERINGQRFDLDAFTFIESITPARALTENITNKDMAHVRNLCSTYLRFSKGELFDVVWRLHLMWYLESLCESHEKLLELTQLMKCANSSTLQVGRLTAQFSDTHVTCANVLRDEIIPMENFLFGKPREEVLIYVKEFEKFLTLYGNNMPILNNDGSLRWAPSK